MTKKLIIGNILILLLIFCANIAYFYANNYPMRFTLLYSLADYDLQYVIIVLLIMSLVAGLVSTLDYKNLNFGNKFLTVFSLLNTIFLIFIISQGVSGFEVSKKEYLSLEKEYIHQARLDIKLDVVTFKYAGGLVIPVCKGDIEHKIDSINKKYGIKYVNTGCVFMEQVSKAQDKYAETVKPYLEKRNGKNWEQKMKKEIEVITKNCK